MPLWQNAALGRDELRCEGVARELEGCLREGAGGWAKHCLRGPKLTGFRCGPREAGRSSCELFEKLRVNH